MKRFTLFATIFILISCSQSIKAQDWDQLIKIAASDRAADDSFGYSVSISGDYAIVGAYQEDEDAAGGNTLSDAGSAYIFYNNSGTWELVQKITASDRAEGDNFGFSVAISGDYAIVGAYQEDEDVAGGNTLFKAGSAYIFHNNSGTSWTQVQKIVASDRAADDRFGYSVSISGDYAIVGAYFEDEDAAGGNTLRFAGSAYIFYNNSGTSWTQVQKIVASDRAEDDIFGFSVSISGNYAIVGAYLEDEDAAGGNTLFSAGSAYIFYNNSGTSWTQVQKITASDRAVADNFGYSVSISGDYAIVGAFREDEDAAGENTLNSAGSAYIFHNNTVSWIQVQKIAASDRAEIDNFGYSVSISGDYAIVGAYFEDEDAAGGNNVFNAGSAYIFNNNSGTSWTQVQKIVASDRALSDIFGYSVSISGDYAIVGAYQEDEDAAGGNTLNIAGSAYIFGNMANLPVELISFTGSLLNNEIILNWSTATEVNNYGFEVQRSKARDQRSENAWEKIGFINGHGNSSSEKNYSFIDKKPLTENTYYRLKQIDNDGSFEYSETVEVSSMKPKMFELAQNYPNPFNPVTVISYSLPEKANVRLVIYDVLGKEVAELVNHKQDTGTYNVEFNGGELNSGIYFYKIEAGKYSQVKKLMLVK
ncbi:MAG: T9SS type A sorting domain-containing protein [Ignavibacteriaceae bacterium]